MTMAGGNNIRTGLVDDNVNCEAGRVDSMHVARLHNLSIFIDEAKIIWLHVRE